MWHKPPFLGYRSREIPWNYLTPGNKPSPLPLFGWTQNVKIHNSCREEDKVQPAPQTDFWGKVLLNIFTSSGGATAQRLPSAFLAINASVFPILAAKAEMPRNAGNCDYTHFIFYILKPQGISCGEQSPVSSMAAEQTLHSSSVQRGRVFAWGETNKDLTDSSSLCIPSWHPWQALANFSHLFLFCCCYFLTFWITQPDSSGGGGITTPHRSRS